MLPLFVVDSLGVICGRPSVFSGSLSSTALYIGGNGFEATPACLLGALSSGEMYRSSSTTGRYDEGPGGGDREKLGEGPSEVREGTKENVPVELVGVIGPVLEFERYTGREH